MAVKSTDLKKVTKGLILAGGQGTRLRPLTYEIPKPLLPVGKIPVISYLVELFLKNGVNDIKVAIQKSHLDDFYKWKVAYFPKNKIDLLIEEKPLGTFTPLIKLTGGWFSEPIVVSNGDELKKLNLKRMIDWHLQKKRIATVGLIKVRNPQLYGVAKMKGNLITEFIEKPEKPPSPYINSGLYIINPEIKDYHSLRNEFAMMEKELFPQLAKEGKLFGYKWQGKWMDVGTFERWEEAIQKWNKK